MITKTILPALEKAKELLTEEKWIKGTMFLLPNNTKSSSIEEALRDIEKCCMCLVGAVNLGNRIVEGPDSISYPMAEVRKTMIKKYPDSFVSVSTWNDEPERKYKEVVELLDLTIERVKQDAVCLNKS